MSCMAARLSAPPFHANFVNRRAMLCMSAARTHAAVALPEASLCASTAEDVVGWDSINVAGILPL